MGIDCPNEDNRSAIWFDVGRMRWRPLEITDKMRRSIGSLGKSVCNTQSSRSSYGNGSKRPMLWHVIGLKRKTFED
jgi:hypothetical protein